MRAGRRRWLSGIRLQPLIGAGHRGRTKDDAALFGNEPKNKPDIDLGSRFLCTTTARYAGGRILIAGTALRQGAAATPKSRCRSPARRSLTPDEKGRPMRLLAVILG